MGKITPIVMPKWGLSMKEGKLIGWLVEEGAKIGSGAEIMEIETDKITNVVEAQEGGVLRRRVGAADTVYPVKALLGVVADQDVPESEIDAFVASFATALAAAGPEEEGPGYEFVELPQGRFRYAKRGAEGPSVILLHGFGGDLDNWLFNIDAIAEAATVYALDLPGHGQSVKSVADPSIAGLAAAVLAFMDALDVKSAHAVGHSMGGAVAIELARKAPKRVLSLSLVAPAGLGPDISSDYIMGFVAAGSRREMKPVLEQLFANTDLVSRQMIEDVLKYKRLDGVAGTLETLSKALFGGGRQQTLLADAAKALKQPKLVVWGKEDRILPAAHAEALAGKATIEVLDGVGHNAQLEAATRVNELIKAHIAR